ncbi:MAG: DNA adenine methylase [Methanoregula sp.]|nr:DNA adenine methylase [Methanoregula sp.]
MISPLVKWAGGKRQLLAALNNRLPDDWNNFYEPFFGGGAFFISLQNQGRISRAVIADLNSELVSFYQVVKTSPEKLIDALSDDVFENSAAAYNRLKNEFNDTVPDRGNAVRRAALFIFLNKHGYNGLWRVNSKGKFNVPFGSYAKRSIPSAASIHLFSAMLRQVTILNTDFEKAVRTARKGDFIYFDPPYLPLSKTARFTGYNCTGFTLDDQVRLAGVFDKLSKKGVQVMLSNSKMQEIEDLYEGYTIETVAATRCINCKGKKRSGMSEIIVTNYDF